MANNLGTNLRTNWMIAIALVGWLMWLLAPVLTPFIAAALLAYIADPLADRLQIVVMALHGAEIRPTNLSRLRK